MEDVELDYEFLTQRALRRVVRDVLTLTEDLGAAPGDHHFYVEFETTADGVVIPDHLIAQYPSRMTIVLQHQFENLLVREEEFEVTLWFKGKQARLVVPFDAVTSFADPSVQFGLRFDAPAAAPAAAKQPAKEAEPETEEDAPAPAGSVVSLDAFRKK